MQLTNRIYDLLKWLTLIFLPALAVLMSSLSDIYAWQNVVHWVSVINTATVFLGTVLQISTYNYHSGGGDNGSNITRSGK